MLLWGSYYPTSRKNICWFLFVYQIIVTWISHHSMTFYILNTITLKISKNLHFIPLSLLVRCLFRQKSIFSCENIIAITPSNLIIFLFRILVPLRFYSQILRTYYFSFKSMLMLWSILLLYNMVIIQSISNDFYLKFSVRLNRGPTDLPILFRFNPRSWLKVWNWRNSVFEWIQHNLEIEVLINLKIY